MFETEDENAELKLIDFGLSRSLLPDGKNVSSGKQALRLMQTACGTTSYLAPEMLEGTL